MYAPPTVSASSKGGDRRPDRRRRDGVSEGREAREVKKIKNVHGTRVTRSIVCAECGAEDLVHFAPRTGARVLCRRCAAQVLGISDSEAGIVPERDLTCTQCGRLERSSWDQPETFACRDCRKGIHSHQRDRSKSAERVGKGRVIRVRKKGDD